MKKTVTIISVLAFLFAIYRFAKRKGISLGKLTPKPPKVCWCIAVLCQKVKG